MWQVGVGRFSMWGGGSAPCGKICGRNDLSGLVLCCCCDSVPLPAPHRAAVDGMDGAFHCLFW